MPFAAASDALTAPTWVTAAFTIVLAVGAIVTAIFAILAFRKQPAQLTILKGQAEDERETNKKLTDAADH